MDDFKPQQPKDLDQPTQEPVGAATPSEEKPEVYQPPVIDPAPIEATPQPVPLAIPKKKSSAQKWLLGGLVVLLLAGLGSFAYWQWAEAESAKQELTSTKAALQAAQEAAKKDETKTEPDTPTTKIKTIEQLVTDSVAGYTAAASGVSFFVRQEKVSGDFASIYMKPEAPNAESSLVLLKKVSGLLVEIGRINGPPIMSKTNADQLKSIYGADVKELGVTVQ